MRITVKLYESAAGVLPEVLEALPPGLAAWAADGSIHVIDNGAEIAIVPVDGLSASQAVDAVLGALKGVI